jgi:hypothetical protein
MNYSAGSSDGLGAPGPSARAAVVPDSRRLQLAQVRLRDLGPAAFSGCNAQPCSCPFSPARRGRFARRGARSLSRTPDVVGFRQDVLMPDEQSLSELRGTAC